MPCRLCAADPHPDNFAAPRKCAFEQEFFSSDNWNCATLNMLRSSDDNESYTEDQTLKVIPFNGAFLLIGFYKARGHTEFASILDERIIAPLSLSVCEAVIAKKETTPCQQSP